MREVKIEELIEDSKSFKIERVTDAISYLEFIKYFEELKEISKHNLIISINFTYGWMPTIFNFKDDNWDEVLSILNRVKEGEEIGYNELDKLKSLLNNSLVGTSKLLHFINPEMYPIWDSRVYTYLYNNKPYHNRVGKIENYIKYKELCKELIAEATFKSVYNNVRAKYKKDYKMSNMRAIELVFFSNSKTRIYNV